MAANLLVRRSTARLLCLVRSQVASFATKRPLPSDPIVTSGSQVVTLMSSDPVASMPADEAYYGAYSGLDQYCKKYNLWKDKRSIDEILDNDKEWQKFCHPTERCMASSRLWCHWNKLKLFGFAILKILFKEHLVKHCSHRKMQWDEAWKFKEALSLPSFMLVAGPTELYYRETAAYRNRKLPKGYKALLLREVEDIKEEIRDYHRRIISDEVVREIEEDIINEINQEFLAKRNPGMARPR